MIAELCVQLWDEAKVAIKSKSCYICGQPVQFCLHTDESFGGARMFHGWRGRMCSMAMSGGDAWFRNVPAEQVEQPLPAWFRRGGLELVFLCQ